MQTFIVATDLSDIAQNAVIYTLNAAKEINARVVIFHLYKFSSHTANSLVSTKNLDEMISRKKTTLEKMASQYQDTFNIPVSAEIRLGDFMEEVQSVVESYQASILIMGMPPKTFEQELLGNNTTTAIFTYKFPILAIPQDVQYKGIKSILFACDLRKGIQELVLDKVKQYAQLFKAKVEVYFVGEAYKQMQEEQQLNTALADIDYEYKAAKQTDSINKMIMAEALSIHADIIIMTPHKYGFWSSIIHQSKTRAMSSNGKIPLLSIPA